MSSFTERTGSAGCTTSTLGETPNCMTPVKSVDRMKRERLVKLPRDHVRGGGDQQRVAVGRGPRDDTGADRSARAGPVVDERLNARNLRELGHDDAPRRVRRAARRVRNHDPDRLRRIALSMR